MSQNENDKHVETEQMAVFILTSMEGTLSLSRFYKDKRFLDMVIIQIKAIFSNSFVYIFLKIRDRLVSYAEFRKKRYVGSANSGILMFYRILA